MLDRAESRWCNLEAVVESTSKKVQSLYDVPRGMREGEIGSQRGVASGNAYQSIKASPLPLLHSPIFSLFPPTHSSSSLSSSSPRVHFFPEIPFP